MPGGDVRRLQGPLSHAFSPELAAPPELAADAAAASGRRSTVRLGPLGGGGAPDRAVASDAPKDAADSLAGRGPDDAAAYEPDGAGGGAPGPRGGGAALGVAPARFDGAV